MAVLFIALLLFIILILRNELLINSHFCIDIFTADFVKKPRDSSAIPAFFALPVTKISNPKNAFY